MTARRVAIASLAIALILVGVETVRAYVGSDGGLYLAIYGLPALGVGLAGLALLRWGGTRPSLRALWMLAALGAGLWLSMVTGNDLVGLLGRAPGGALRFGWPAISVSTSTGVGYFYPSDPLFWIPALFLVAGGATAWSVTRGLAVEP